MELVLPRHVGESEARHFLDRHRVWAYQKLEDIIDKDYDIVREEIVDDDDEVAERMYSVQNSQLFFGSLYPTKNTNSYNNDFYWFSFAVLVYMCSVLY